MPNFNRFFLLLFVSCALFLTPHATHAQQSPALLSYQKPDGSIVELLAGADTDGDGIDNELELNGFVFDLASGELQAWDGDPSKKHFFTDPLRASTDGDPYSDYMEVTGANMPGSIEAPYNHPLVAARPIIAVYMTDYEVIPNGEITDEEGHSTTDSFTNETTNEDQFGVGISTEFSLNPFELASVSVEANYSHTHAVTNSTTSSSEFNWSSARSVSESEAARLRLNVYYVNLGSAPASNVRPTFNLMLGNKVIATFQSSLNSEAQTLAPGARFPTNGSIAIDSYVAGEVDRDIILNLEELKAIQRGAPLSIVVPQVEANILRWNEATQSFSNEITWADYEQDIDPVSITLETNIGGKSAQYQVYTGSPQFPDPLRNLRETLELIFDVEERNGITYINDRRYPEQWYFATDSEQIIEAEAQASDLLDVPMYRGNRIVMLSPGFDSAPNVNNTTFSSNLKYVYASARPIDGFPITHAVATLYAETRTREVQLDPIPGSAFISNIDPIEGIYYGGFVTVFNARGDARVEELTSPGRITAYQSCADRQNTEFGEYGIPLSGNLDTLFRVSCRYLGDDGLVSEERPWTEVGEVLQGIPHTDEVYAVTSAIALRATQTGGINAIQRSTDGGQTWSSPAAPTNGGRIHGFYFHDELVGFAVGDEGGIWKTENAGARWSRIPQPYTTGSLNSIDFLDENTGLVVGSSGSALKTSDGGNTWTPFTVFAPGNDYPDYGKLTLSDVQYINFERIAITSFSSILMSYDGGNTWEAHPVEEIVSIPPETCCVNAKDLQFPSTSTGYFVGSFLPRRLFKTTDGGNSWNAIPMPEDALVNDFHFFDPLNGIAVGSDIYHTTDGGLTWVKQRATTIPDVSYNNIHFRNGLGLLAGRKDDGSNVTSYLFHTTLAGTDLTTGPEGRPHSIRPKNVLRYDGNPKFINGSTTVDEAAQILKQYDYVILGDTALRSNPEAEIYAFGDHPDLQNTRFFVAVDVGVTTANLQGTDLAIPIVSHSNVYLRNFSSEYGVDRARQNEALHWANSNGTTVLIDAPPEELFTSDVDAVFNPDGVPLDLLHTAFYYYGDYLVSGGSYVSREAWREKADQVSEASKDIGFRVLATTSPAAGGAYNEDQFHFAWHGALIDGFEGIGWSEPAFSADNNAPFRPRPDVVPGRTFFTDITLDGNLVSRRMENGEASINVATHTYIFGAAMMPTDTEAETPLPQQITLQQNYPNPFNGFTSIPFELAQSGPVKLEVFDLLGRRIATLVDSNQPAGAYTVQFDAHRLSSGMYLYRIQADGKSETKQMIVVR